MSRPRSINWQEPPVITDDEIEARWKQLDTRLSAMIRRLIESRKLSQSAFGRKIGFTQANLSNVFNPEREDNHWSFPLLIAAAELFGTTVGHLLCAAERYAKHGETSERCIRALSATDSAAFKIGDTVVRKQELLNGCINRTDVKKYRVYAVFTTAAGTQYQLNDPAEEYQEDWYFENEGDLASISSAEKMRAKINAALNEVDE